MPCQHAPHGNLDGREKLNSIKKGACDEKCMEGRVGQWFRVHSYLRGSSCIYCPPFYPAASTITAAQTDHKPLNRQTIQNQTVTHVALRSKNAAPIYGYHFRSNEHMKIIVQT